jgi:hypothetical protein
MNDGPTPDDFCARVFRDRKHTGDWRVEKLLDDGESSEVAILAMAMLASAPSGTPIANTAALDEIELELELLVRGSELGQVSSSVDGCVY